MSHQHRTTHRWGNTAQGATRCTGQQRGTHSYMGKRFSFSLASSSSPHFSVFPKLSSSISSLWCCSADNPLRTHHFIAQFSPPPNLQYTPSVFLSHWNVGSCLPPWWRPVFHQTILFLGAKVLQWIEFLFGFCCERLTVGGSTVGWRDKVSQEGGHGYWEAGKTKDATRRRQEAQLDKESKRTFFKEARKSHKTRAHGVHRNRNKRNTSYLSLLQTYSTSLRKHGWKGTQGDGGRERKRYLSCEWMKHWQQWVEERKKTCMKFEGGPCSASQCLGT